MIKRFVLVIVVMAMAAMTWAQDTVDNEPAFSTYPPHYDNIKAVISDPGSHLYYPKLVKIFEEMDTALINLDVMRCFYYGSVFQKDFDPYGTPDELDEVEKILEEGSESQLKKAEQLVNKAIKAKPTLLRSYYYKRYIEYFLNDTVELKKVDLQLDFLLYTIRSTGDGTSPEEAFFCTSVNDSYMLMNLFGFAPKGQALVYHDSSAYDVFTLKENEHGIEKLYFNVDKCMSYLGGVFGSTPVAEKSSKTTHELTVNLGTKFVIELKKIKGKKSTFDIVSTEAYADTLLMNQEGLFPDEVPANQIIGYYAPLKLTEDSEVSFSLLFKGNTGKVMLYMDTEILNDRTGKFETTSNSGIYNNALMNELWPYPYPQIRISNIRTKK